MHESLELRILAKKFADDAERPRENEQQRRQHEARLRVLKLRWMGFEAEADALERELAQDFATRVTALHSIVVA